MKMQTANLKSGGLTAATVMGGMMAANAGTKLIPIENQLITKAIPGVLGIAGMLLVNNKHVTNAAVGMVVHSGLSVANHLIRGTQAGVNGITDNPTVAKIVDVLVPNLGNTEEQFVIPYAGNEGNFVEELGYAEEAGDFSDAMLDTEMDFEDDFSDSLEGFNNDQF